VAAAVEATAAAAAAVVDTRMGMTLLEETMLALVAATMIATTQLGKLDIKAL
jgi:hypothetical protein